MAGMHMLCRHADYAEGVTYFFSCHHHRAPDHANVGFIWNFCDVGYPFYVSGT